MQYNPYAPPQAAPPQMSPGGQGPNAGPQPWSVGEALSVGWESLKVHGVTLVLTYLVSALPGFGISQISNQFAKAYVDPTDPLAAFSEPGYWALSLGVQIPIMILAAFFQGGLIKIWIAAARGQSPNFGDLFTGGRTFLPILLLTFINQLVLIFSLPLLFVPAVIWFCGMGFAPYFMVDESLGFIDSLKKSWQITTGHKGSIFVYGLATFGVTILGLCACCIGILAAMPLAAVGFSLIYTRLSGNTGTPGGYGMPYGGMPPMGGGPMGGAPPGYGGGPNQPQGGFGQPGGYGPPPGY